MTHANRVPTAAPSFDKDYRLFPDVSPSTVFANNLAVLMNLVHHLPSGAMTSEACERQAANRTAETCISHFLDTESQASSNGLLLTTDVAAMLYMNLAWHMMCRLKDMRTQEVFEETLWEAARGGYNNLLNLLGTGVNDAF